MKFYMENDMTLGNFFKAVFTLWPNIYIVTRPQLTDKRFSTFQSKIIKFKAFHMSPFYQSVLNYFIYPVPIFDKVMIQPKSWKNFNFCQENENSDSELFSCWNWLVLWIVHNTNFNFIKIENIKHEIDKSLYIFRG